MNRDRSWLILMGLLCLVLVNQNFSHAALMYAQVEARAHEHDQFVYSRLEYSGDSSAFSPMSLVKDDSEHNGRYAESRFDMESAFVSSSALQTGVFDTPNAGTGAWWFVTFENNSELQDLMIANGGQPIEMLARFYVEFDLTIVPGGGIFEQTRTEAGLVAESITNGLIAHTQFSATVAGGLVAGNSHDGTHGIVTSGVLSPELIGAGPFPIFLPFVVSNSSQESLSPRLGFRIGSDALSLGGGRPIGSSVRVWYPTQDDIFFAPGFQEPGRSAASMGLQFDTPFLPQAVPEPGTLTLAGIGAFGFAFRIIRRRKLQPA